MRYWTYKFVSWCRILLEDLRLITIALLVQSTHTIQYLKMSNFVLVRLRTLLVINSFRYLGLKLWSNVPENIKNLKKYKFKYQYKTFFLSFYGDWIYGALNCMLLIFCCILLSTDCVWFVVWLCELMKESILYLSFLL